MPYICERSETTKSAEQSTKAPASIVKATIKSLKSSLVAKEKFDNEQANAALSKLLGKDEWITISKEIL